MEQLLYVNPSLEGGQEPQEVLPIGEAEHLRTQFWSWVRMHNRFSRCPNPWGRRFLGAEHPLQLFPRAALTGLANSGTSPVQAALTTNAVLPQRPGSTPDRPRLNRRLVTAGAGSAEREGSQGCSECRCLSLNVQSCKSEHPDWRELKAWCSVPINSTVYCQSSLDWQSSTHQFKWAFVVIEERSVGWIPIRAHSLWVGSICERLQTPFGGLILIGTGHETEGVAGEGDEGNYTHRSLDLGDHWIFPPVFYTEV